jgi:hypothetical protein
MEAGEQSPGVNYLQHGEQVANKFAALMALAEKAAIDKDRFVDATGVKWRLPKWFVRNQTWIHAQLKPHFIKLRTYQTWHDCGKPLVKEMDNEAIAHYPDHALVSANAWRAAGGDDEEVAHLIENDMLCHHLRTVEETVKYAHEESWLLALMVTALAEMHVCEPPRKGTSANENADEEAFVCPLDLTTQDGFKIKLKRMNDCGKAMMRVLLSK